MSAEDKGRSPAEVRRWREAMAAARKAVIKSWPQQVSEANARAKGRR